MILEVSPVILQCYYSVDIIRIKNIIQVGFSKTISTSSILSGIIK